MTVVSQDCEYTYDLSGNIVGMVDASPSAGVGGTGTLDRDFGYDALYRLLSATGRESGTYAVSGTPWNEAHVPDQTVGGTVAYTRTYSYDLLGNMLRLRHVGGSTWDRWYNDADTLGDDAYETANTLGKVKYGATTVTQSYDAVGNLVLEGTTRHLEWDAADRLRAFYDQGGTSEPTVYAHYLYDAGGNRVKKVVRKSTGNTEVTVYVDGVFEYIYQLDGFGVVAEECNEVHVMDGRSRVARLKYFGSTWTGSTTDDVRYNLEDHLGNAAFTLDDGGVGVSREEYFPFGETSFGSYTKKRYRFCGKERDGESGFYYYGARYYAAWCCRFVSVDPLAGAYVFYTPYQYAGNMPIISVDIDGLEGSVSTINNVPRTTIRSSSTNRGAIRGGKSGFEYFVGPDGGTYIRQPVPGGAPHWEEMQDLLVTGIESDLPKRSILEKPYDPNGRLSKEEITTIGEQGRRDLQKQALHKEASTASKYSTLMEKTLVAPTPDFSLIGSADSGAQPEETPEEEPRKPEERLGMDSNDGCIPCGERKYQLAFGFEGDLVFFAGKTGFRTFASWQRLGFTEYSAKQLTALPQEFWDVFQELSERKDVCFNFNLTGEGGKVLNRRYLDLWTEYIEKQYPKDHPDRPKKFGHTSVTATELLRVLDIQQEDPNAVRFWIREFNNYKELKGYTFE